MMKPIYKCKGDREDLSNYRPIILIRCLGKGFTAMLNNRIQTFAERYDLINESQSGFRKGCSTTDNIFILHNLIELVCKSKQLYCALLLT